MIMVPQRYGHMDRRTDRQTDRLVGAYARSPAYSWVQPYNTVNTYSKPPLYYTLGAVAPLLLCLRSPAVLTHGTHSRAWRPSAAGGQTDTRQTRLTTNQPTSQPFCQYPAVCWELP